MKNVNSQLDLVGYWKFDEGQGTIAYDSSTYGNNGTVYGATWTTNCKSENCSYFDSIDDYVEVPDDDSLDGFTSGASWSFWVKPENLKNMLPGGFRFLLSKYDTSGNQRAWFIDFYNSSGNKQIRLTLSSDGINFNQSAKSYSFMDGEWYHIAWTWERGQIPKLYINGEQQTLSIPGVSLTNIYSSNAPLIFAKCYYSPANRYLNGTIDGVKVWNRALTESEISDEYEMGATKLIVGVNGYSGTPESQLFQRDLPFLNDIGIRHVRLGAVNTGNLVNYDRNVDNLTANGIEVIGTLHRKDLAGDPVAFGDYVYSMVDHFKNRIHYWIIWNEPNWDFGSPLTASDYTNLLQEAYTRAKEADPYIKIITGNLLATESSINYLNEMYNNGAKGYFDIVSIDPYCYPASPLEPNVGASGHTFWRLPQFRDVMINHGDQDKKIWIVEFGYNTNITASNSVTEEQQALYIEQALTLTSTWDWVERFYVYQWMDSAPPSCCWGLIKEDYSPPYDRPHKPAFYAVKEFISGTTTTTTTISTTTTTTTTTISTTTTIPPDTIVTVDSGNVISLNNFSTASQLSFSFTVDFPKDSVYKQLATNASFKLFRAMAWLIGYDYGPGGTYTGGGRYHPCRYWNESNYSKSQWDWQYVDSLAQNISNLGAEPFIVLSWMRDNVQNYIPPGMAVNPDTSIPYPASYAAYARAWVKHFKDRGWPVRFYEISNEPWTYFGWNNYTRIANFMALFNAAAQEMRAENPNVTVGFDGTNRKPVLDYWLANGGADLGFISFHKYDTGTIGQYNDTEMLNRAETYQIDTSSSYYGIKDAQQTYYNARGERIPVINSESNFNSASETGTDPRIQQIVGATWTALVLRKSILNGLQYSVYFDWAASKSWEQASKPSGGFGFGMINSDDKKPWYPYYVQKGIGNNIAVGDSIVNSTSSSDDIRSLTWINNGKLNILLVHKSNQTKTVSLQGVTGQLNYQKIDDPTGTSYLNPVVQTGTIDVSDIITMNGYTVMLLQKSISPTSTTTTIPSDTEKPRWSNLYRNPPEPTIITTLDSVTINVTWYDNQNLGTVIIWENSTGTWQGHTI